ncbi:hypothetical protein B0H15DRAFT_28129 [Mycena belliarum]|uniref:DUF6699 domain-containing protein n=1 Tax=Mycena belliarum TaxID=1033014 RepID=A0AAD6UJY5_9AGAR|nr:hypothetical protein B0H15DRAFT_28129 [Mycena belliae]
MVRADAETGVLAGLTRTSHPLSSFAGTSCPTLATTRRSPYELAQCDLAPGEAPWHSDPYPYGPYVPQWAPGFGGPSASSPWPEFIPPPSPGPYPLGTYAPQWAPGFGGPPPALSPWQGFIPPPSPGPGQYPYGFAPLEDTDRIPRPSDMVPLWASFGEQQPMSPWGDGPPPLIAPDGVNLPLQAAFGGPFANYAGPITPMPMASAFAMQPQFSQSPFLTPVGMLQPLPAPPGPLGPDGIQPILFTKKYPYESENLAPRPSDWRRDYAPPRRFRFGSRLFAGAEHQINLEHCHLSPLLLMPNSRMPIMAFDLRSDHPFDPLNLELLATAGRPFNSTDLAQLATTRPVRRLRFYHPRLPWYLDVVASQPNGVLVGDVLHQIHEKLHRQIRPQDFSNTVLDATDRELITDAYRARCDDRVDLMQQGVRRVDFMGSDVILKGFMEGRNGMWLMKTTRFNRDMDT